jgi:hypothetical protein
MSEAKSSTAYLSAVEGLVHKISHYRFEMTNSLGTGF